MGSRTRLLLREVLALPLNERAQVAAELLASLDENPFGDIFDEDGLEGDDEPPLEDGLAGWHRSTRRTEH